MLRWGKAGNLECGIMKDTVYDSLQLREIFHLEFLRWLGRKARESFSRYTGGYGVKQEVTV